MQIKQQQQTTQGWRVILILNITTSFLIQPGGTYNQKLSHVVISRTVLAEQLLRYKCFQRKGRKRLHLGEANCFASSLLMLPLVFLCVFCFNVFKYIPNTVQLWIYCSEIRLCSLPTDMLSSCISVVCLRCWCGNRPTHCRFHVAWQ